MLLGWLAHGRLWASDRVEFICLLHQNPEGGGFTITTTLMWLPPGQKAMTKPEPHLTQLSFLRAIPVSLTSITNTQSFFTSAHLFMAFPQHPFPSSGPQPSLPTSTSKPIVRVENPPSDIATHPPESPKDLVPATEPNAVYKFRCTACWRERDPPPHTFGLESRIVCVDC